MSRPGGVVPLQTETAVGSPDKEGYGGFLMTKINTAHEIIAGGQLPSNIQDHVLCSSSFQDTGSHQW